MAFTAEKTIAFYFADKPDEARKVSIAPGTTCGEALELADYDPVKTRVVNLGTVLSNAENLFDMVEEGDRVLVTGDFVAGVAA